MGRFADLFGKGEETVQANTPSTPSSPAPDREPAGAQDEPAPLHSEQEHVAEPTAEGRDREDGSSLESPWGEDHESETGRDPVQPLSMQSRENDEENLSPNIAPPPIQTAHGGGDFSWEQPGERARTEPGSRVSVVDEQPPRPAPPAGRLRGGVQVAHLQGVPVGSPGRRRVHRHLQGVRTNADPARPEHGPARGHGLDDPRAVRYRKVGLHQAHGRSALPRSRATSSSTASRCRTCPTTTCSRCARSSACCSRTARCSAR